MQKLLTNSAATSRRQNSPRVKAVLRAALTALCFAACCGASAHIAGGKTVKLLSEKEARRVVARTAGAELKTDAVRVRDISAPGDGTAIVAAGVETPFRFTRTKEGKWVAAEFRIGDRRWEEIDFFEDAVGTKELRLAREELGALTNDFIALRKDDKEAKELRRGMLRATDVSSVLKSAVVVIEVEASFRLAKDAGKKWRVVEIKFGNGGWQSVDALTAAANAAKNARARDELRGVRAALEKYRLERGAYVVADEYSALVDNLSPRYLSTVVRLDPWQRPYRYEGTRERFILRSDGADGKEDTADDVRISSSGDQST